MAGFDLGSVVAHIKADVTGFQEGMQSAQKGLSNFKDKLGDFGQNMQVAGAKMSLFAAPVALFFKDASQQAIELERSLTTLDIIAGRFGVSGDKAKQSAQALGSELRIGVSSAAAGLQNLLKSGLSLDQATDLLKRFTNEAITGKSPQISLAQAVENLSFAYATNNSAIGNLSGINENFVNIIDKGREALIKEGVAANTITDEMAKYRGMIDLTNLTMGSAERFHGTLIDKQAELGQKVIELKTAIGDILNPVLSQLIDFLTTIVNWFASLDQNQQQLIVTVGILVIALGPLMILIGLISSGISVLIGVATTLGTVLAFLAFNPIGWIIVAITALIAIGVLLVKNWDWIKETGQKMLEFLTSKFNSFVDFLRGWGGKIIDALVSPFQSAWGRIQDLMNKIKDALDFTKRHSPSVVDIVRIGVDKVNNALEGLDFGQQLMPKPSLAFAGAGMGSTPIYQVRVDMGGSMVYNDAVAQEMGERIGDSIIKQLSTQIRH